MKLGLVTYNLAKEWDLETILARCETTGFAGVELRTTHAHGVEAELTAQQRAEVKARFADSEVNLVGLGTAFEYHALDPAVVKENVEGTKSYVQLAADVGADGIKVRPNGDQTAQGIPKEKTLEQIGSALRECGTYAKDYGVEIRLEMHGSVRDAEDMAQIIAHAGDHIHICWNSNETDVKDGSVAHDYALMRKHIRLVHINELWKDCFGIYPYAELFRLLQADSYSGYLCAEVPASPEPERFMSYYRALFEQLCGA